MTHIDRTPHRLVLQNGEGRRIFDFVLESTGRMGWAWLRLVRIEDDPPIVGVPAVVNYDPAVHNVGSYSLTHKGWAWLRRFRIEDDPLIVGVPAVVNYDPAIHDGGSHYMFHLWRARGIHLDGAMRYRLVGAFGSPGYIQLERVD